ncbi:U3 small nucleolar ribonucleo MPP10 [Olea europaea subsp. europaea]|uniref:U3 small nucleolar ribonucleo MPP10 n=1 Tax=Olea europaea subsp. europaea TaxID=158383 RepID=A0A8S0SKK1_OLEEU|nr:U3 small nucleolar ribonucleo MPP10 [Olea europaea subsp. europaea]
MVSTTDGGAKQAGLNSIHRLKSIEPPFFLSSSPDFSQAARSASQYLFSSLKPFALKPLFNLAANRFAIPALLSLRRHVKQFEKNPEEIQKQFDLEREKFADYKKDETETEDDNDKLVTQEGGGIDGLESESEGFDEDEEEDDGVDGEIEDKENANEKEKKKKRKRGEIRDGDGDGDEESDEEDDEDGRRRRRRRRTRYEEFFGGKRTGQGKKPKVFGRSNDSDMDYGNSNQKNTLSTHEKELEKLRSEIEMMEKANLDPKTWTMQGEVTAAKRPKNSALEVDLDFEHNVRPAPVITEEVTASLEE